MTTQQFMALGNLLKEELKMRSPIDTGNLRYNSITMRMVSPDEIRIYIDEAIAPYMPFTNEPWISPRWNGKKNPNEHWFDNAAEYLVKFIADNYNGTASYKG